MSKAAPSPARYRALFPERAGLILALLEGLAWEVPWCADVEARAGIVSERLRAGGAEQVWAFDAEPDWYSAGAHRFLCAEPSWLPMHPHVRAEGPQDGFDVVVCGSGLERALKPGMLMEALLAPLAGLLRGGGRLVFDVPVSGVGEEPVMDRIGGGVARMRQRVGSVVWEVRSVAGEAPLIERWSAASLEDWREALDELTFASITSQAISDERVRWIAERE